MDAVLGPEPHCSRNDFGSTCRHAHDRDVGRDSATLPFNQEGEPVHYRHHQIEQDYARFPELELPQPFTSVGCEHYLMAAACQGGPLELAHVGIVFDYENRGQTTVSSVCTRARASSSSLEGSPAVEVVPER